VLFGADLLIGNEVAISPSALDGHSRQRSSPEVTERSAATMLLGLEIPPRISKSVRNAPVYSVRDAPGPYRAPPSPSVFHKCSF